MSVHGHVPAALLPGKTHVIPIEYGAGWIQEEEWTYWRQDIFFSLPQI